jgi:hypothetical protein
MNFAEIKEKLQKLKLKEKELGYYAQNGECILYDDDRGVEIDVVGILEENFGKVEIVETSYFHDGYECWCVYSFIEQNVFIKIKGYFSSYDDTDWSGMIEVFPEEKMITVYNEKPRKK